MGHEPQNVRVRRPTRRRHEEKYTRGSCHAHAAASVEVHGGRILGLMWKGKVVHVLSLHVDDGLTFTKDVTGDEAWPEDWSFAPEDFRGLSEAHLLGCPIDAVIVSDLLPWGLPCAAPTAEEMLDARVLSTVLTPPGMRCPDPDDDFSFGF